MADVDRRYRVVVWATGAQGSEAIRAILDSADFELAGVKVFSPEKDGLDAGVIAGRAPVGVRATRDPAAVLALAADCVLYVPRVTSLDEVCTLLAGGMNVVTTAFLFHPARLPVADRDRLQAACDQGGTTVHGTGLNPGSVSGALVLAVSGFSRRIDRITIQERADWSFYESTAITFDNMRFGRPPGEVSEQASDFLAFNSGIFQEQVWMIADALGAGIDEVTSAVELAVAEADHEIFGVPLRRGTVSGQHWRWTGRRAGQALVEIETLWTVGGEYPGHWPRPRDGWTVTIEGDPSIRTHLLTIGSFERDLPLAEHVRAASVATVMHALNSVPAVVAAPPGFATADGLPLVLSRAGFGNA